MRTPIDPPFGFGNPPSNNDAWKSFADAMVPFWRLVLQSLARQRPKIWMGYRCEIEVTWHQASGKFLFEVKFADAVSNRVKKIESTKMLELLGSLHEAYRAFDRQLQWKKVILHLTWEEKEKRWGERIEWEYCQQGHSH